MSTERQIRSVDARDEAIAAVQALHEFLRVSRPQWTHDIPAREGFYWVRGSKRENALVVQVKVDYSISSTPLVVQAGHPEDNGVQFIETYKDCQWCGPLEQPH